jgi:hypothetical protein
MKKLLLLLLPLLLLIIGSCKKDPAEPERHRRTVPFTGTFATLTTILSDPPLVQQKITGTGRLSPLGAASFDAMSTLVLTPPPPFQLSGPSTMTLANGDQLYSNFTGTASPQEGGKLLVTIHHTFTGGTGRFRHATGYYDGVTLADDPSNPAASLTIKGELTY